MKWTVADFRFPVTPCPQFLCGVSFLHINTLSAPLLAKHECPISRISRVSVNNFVVTGAWILTDVWMLVSMHIHRHISHTFLMDGSCNNASIDGLQTLQI